MEIEKIWGKEIWLLNDPIHKYCHKRLVLDKGAIGSLHSHRYKMETLSVENGVVKMECGKEIYELKEGDTVTITPGMNHRFSGIANASIFETSLDHREDDVNRIEGSKFGSILFGVDVDGTLVSSKGKIGKEHLDGKEFVIISSRSIQRSREACEEIGVTPINIINCRVLSRAEEMRHVDVLYPLRRTIYIGDMESDRNEALRAGWKFMYPDEFINYCQNGFKGGIK